MRKIYTLLLFALIASLSGISAQTTIFYESFDNFTETGGNDNQFSGNVSSKAVKDASLFDNAGWTYENAYQASACLKLGASKKAGKATTPALTNLNGDAVLTFRAAAWKGDATTLKISINGGGSLSEASVVMVNEAFSDYSVNITGGTSASTITFESEKASKGRFFLDEVKIVSAAAPTEVAAPVISGVEDGGIYKVSATVKIAYPALATSMTYSITKQGETETPVTVTTDVEKTITETGVYTVKASATDGTATKEATAITFTVEDITKAASIAEFISKGTELGEAEVIEITAPLYVAHQSGNRLFVRDEAGSALLIYGNTGNTYANGDVIPAGAKGTFSNYMNFTPEMMNPVLEAATGEKVAVDPTETTIDAITVADVNKYIVLKGLTVTEPTKNIGNITDANNNEMVYSNSLGAELPADYTKTYDLVAIVTVYNEAAQVYSVEFTESTGTSGVAEVGSEDAAISTNANGVVVRANEAVAVSIFNAAGQVVKSEVADGETTIAVPAGFYIVRAGNAVAKVVVK